MTRWAGFLSLTGLLLLSSSGLWSVGQAQFSSSSDSSIGSEGSVSSNTNSSSGSVLEGGSTSTSSDSSTSSNSDDSSDDSRTPPPTRPVNFSVPPQATPAPPNETDDNVSSVVPSGSASSRGGQSEAGDDKSSSADANETTTAVPPTTTTTTAPLEATDAPITGQATACAARFLTPTGGVDSYAAAPSRSSSSGCEGVSQCQRILCTCIGGVTGSSGACSGLLVAGPTPPTATQCSSEARCFSSFITCLHSVVTTFASTAGRTSGSAGRSACQLWADPKALTFTSIKAGVPYNSTSLAPSCRYLACSWLPATSGLDLCPTATQSNEPNQLCMAPLGSEGPFYGRFTVSGAGWRWMLSDQVKAAEIELAALGMFEGFLGYRCVVTALKPGSLIIDVTVHTSPSSATLKQLLRNFKAASAKTSAHSTTNVLYPLQVLYSRYAKDSSSLNSQEAITLVSLVQLDGPDGEVVGNGQSGSQGGVFTFGEKTCNPVCLALVILSCVCVLALVGLCMWKVMCKKSRQKKHRQNDDSSDSDGEPMEDRQRFHHGRAKNLDSSEFDNDSRDGLRHFGGSGSPSRYLSGAPSKYHHHPAPSSIHSGGSPIRRTGAELGGGVHDGSTIAASTPREGGGLPPMAPRTRGGGGGMMGQGPRNLHPVHYGRDSQEMSVPNAYTPSHGTPRGGDEFDQW